MENLNPIHLREKAQWTLNRGREPQKVVYSYAGITLAVSALLTLVSLLLDNRIANTGGLSNLDTRAILSTIGQALPMVASLAAMCLELGYLHAMMRISRGQYADHTDLKVGFQRFWPLLRMVILQGILYMGIGFLAFQVSFTVFMLSPWSGPVMDVLIPLVEAGVTTMDEALVMELSGQLVPLLVMFGIAFLAIWIPFLYWFRMANYCLLDNPRAGALAALRTSRKLMRRRFGAMLKIDLSLWPYYLATLVMTLVLWLDQILPLLGISLGMDPQLLYLVCYGCALVIQFVIQITLRNRVETIYLLAYESLREKTKDEGVVLGNIFDM